MSVIRNKKHVLTKKGEQIMNTFKEECTQKRREDFGVPCPQEFRDPTPYLKPFVGHIARSADIVDGRDVFLVEKFEEKLGIRSPADLLRPNVEDLVANGINVLLDKWEWPSG